QTTVRGMSWVWRTRGLLGESSLNGIAFGNRRFVAVGEYRTILRSGSIITLAMPPSADTGRITLSLEGPTGLEYTIHTSTDLMSWRNLTNITSIQPSSVIWTRCLLAQTTFSTAPMLSDLQDRSSAE